MVHTEGLDGDIDHSCADLSRSRAELGYEPTVDLRTSFRGLLDGESLTAG